jgi:hypothetical protein
LQLIQILRINGCVAVAQRFAMAKLVAVNRPRAARNASKASFGGANIAVGITKSGGLGLAALYRALTLSRGTEYSGGKAGVCEPFFEVGP